MRRVVAFAPGRVNLIGEHTDYNQGLALPFAIHQGVTVTATELSRPWIEAVAAELGERDSFPVEDPSPSDGWRAFVRGTVAELQRAGMTIVGTRVEINSTVPMGSGLGSSAALEVALALALIGLARHPEPDPRRLAELCSRVENEWVGARTGLLDQLTCLMGSENHAVQIDFRSLDAMPVSLALGEWQLALLDSGESHANRTSGYNERRKECSRACELLGVESLREATLSDAARLPPTLERRVRHVLAENRRVLGSARAIGQGDMPALGTLIDASHASLRDLYEVSTPAVEETVERLKEIGAAGARLVGGGFGGHVLALLPPMADMLPEMIEVRPCAGARWAASNQPGS